MYKICYIRFDIIRFHFVRKNRKHGNTFCCNLRSSRIFDVGVKLSLTRAFSHQIEVVGFLLPRDATWVDYWPHKGRGLHFLHPRSFIPQQSCPSYSITARIKSTCDCCKEELSCGCCLLERIWEDDTPSSLRVGTKRIANRRSVLCDEEKGRVAHDSRRFLPVHESDHPSDIMISLVSAHFRLVRVNSYQRKVVS